MKAGVVAFAFGSPYNVSSNRCIAGIASRKAQELGTSIYTQHDILPDVAIRAEYIEEDLFDLPTLRIARGAVKWVQRYKFQELWIAAARPHLARCMRDLTYAMRVANVELKIYVCEEIRAYPEEAWYCPDSLQARTRSRAAWRRREWILEHMPMFFYRFIAQ